MRICLVSFEYPPFERGGIATYAGVLSGALAEAGHDVHVVTNAGAPGDGAAADPAPAGVSVSRLPTLDRRYRPLDSDPDPLRRALASWEPSLLWSTAAADRLAELHAERPFDVAEFPECFAEAHVALRRRRAGHSLVDLPIALTLHTPIWEHHAFNGLARRERTLLRRSQMEDSALTRAEALSSPSRALRDVVYERLGLDAGAHPCEVIPYPMDLGAFPAEPADEEASPPTVVFAGRLEPRKGVFDLVEAAVPLMQRRPDLRLELIGADAAWGGGASSTRAELERRVPPRLRDRVRFAGAQPRATLFPRFRQAAVSVFPALWDNFPYACCEALASGGCVLASAAGGQAEIVEHERSGLLVAPGAPGELSGALERLLDSAPLRRRLREGAVARIRALCAPEQVVPRRLRLYETAAERLRQRRGGAASG